MTSARYWFVSRRSWVAWVLILYVVSYLVFSRAAYSRADAANAEGFYFVFPSSPATVFANDLCFAIYWPLVEMDKLLGTGRPRASDPLRLLSNRRSHTAMGTGRSEKDMHNR